MSNRHLKFFSHINEDIYRLGPGLKIGRRIVPKFASATVAKVRADEGYQFRSFAELVRCIAELGSSNSRFNLLFRGQGNDYRDRNGRTKLYPSIYRPHVPNGQLRVARPKLIWLAPQNLYSSQFPVPLGDGEEANYALPLEEFRSHFRGYAREKFIGIRGPIRVRLLKMNVYTSAGAVFRCRPGKALRELLKKLAEEKRKGGTA